MKYVKKMKCPLCNGTGCYVRVKSGKGDWVRELRKKGYKFREILKITGLRSLSTVHFHINKEQPNA